MIFKSKLQTLQYIKSKDKKLIPDFFGFNVGAYLSNYKKILKKIDKSFLKNIAIRSSFLNEDQKNISNAGKYLSILNIDPKNKNEIDKSIKKVINSYKGYQNNKNEILIQKMVKNVKIAGVAFTADKTINSQYYEINYAKNADSTVITSGKETGEKLIFFKESKIFPVNNLQKKIIKFVIRIEKILKYNYLDIEFVIDKGKKIHLLQVRPLVKKNYKKLDFNFKFYLDGLSKKIQKIQEKNTNLFGKTTFFSNMSDWNPAEMIGLKPKPLSISLYQELITNSVWSEQRKKYGYHFVKNFPLMLNLYGSPYIDLRVDFNSWLPKDLNNGLKEKLVNYYLKKFKKKPDCHDKIEFELVFTCFTLSTRKKLKELYKYGFTSKEISEIIISLKKITNNLIALKKEDKNKIDFLSRRHDKIIKSNVYNINKIYLLVLDCKNYGTNAFAGLARCAFVASDILNSFADKGIITQDEKNNFLNSLPIITTDIVNEFFNMSKVKFLRKYGHLRPGTYDLLSDNYNAGYSKYFKNIK